MADKVKIGIIGVGTISPAYFAGLKLFSDVLEPVACADIKMDVAEAKGAQFNVKPMTVKQLLADPQIELVINLTPPLAHAEVDRAALLAGKHVHSEKPFAVERSAGLEILKLARRKKLRVGCAPDTFLGAGIQTCRKIIDGGWIGKPLAGTAFMMSCGPEGWHPNPFFLFERGGGPMLDMGPYYISALVNLLGPVKRVAGLTQTSFKERVPGHPDLIGRKIKVEVPTHVAGTLEFASGAIITMVMSWEVPAHQMPPIQIFGTEGSLSVPDPNTFGGPVKLFRPGMNAEWRKMPLVNPYCEQSRGIGAADMVYALRSGRPHRCSGEFVFHVLDVMQAFHESSLSGRIVTIRSTTERPAPLPTGLRKGQLDA